MLLCIVNGALAASWRWSIASSGRERLQITLDVPDTGLTVERTGTQTLSVNLTQANHFSAQPAPEQSQLFTGATQRETKIEVALSSPAFGYIVLRPSPVQVLVDVYPDPLGTRWRPPDMPVAKATAERQEALVPGAHAASPTAAPSTQERNIRITPQGIRASINKAGPDAWPEDTSFASESSAPPSTTPASRCESAACPEKTPARRRPPG